MLTLIDTSPNLIISSFRARSMGISFNMFEFSHVGLPTAIIAVFFIELLRWRLLVMGSGRYKFFDYMRLGPPLEIIVFLAMAIP